VSLMDLLPTLAELSGAVAPPGLMGQTLVPALSGERPLQPRALLAMATTTGPEWVSIRVAGYKLILNQDTGSRMLCLEETAAPPSDDTRELLRSRGYTQWKAASGATTEAAAGAPRGRSKARGLLRCAR